MSDFSDFWSSCLASDDPCSVPGCVNKKSTKGICSAHSHRLARYGSVHGGKQRLSGELIRWLQDAWRTTTDECQLWPFPCDGKGYGLFSLKGKLYRSHNYACQMFNGPAPSSKNHAAHECGNSLCVNPRHISWKTALDNIADKKRHGTNLEGERHHQSKLTLADVEKIRKMSSEGMAKKELANIFGVKTPTIEDLLAGKTWRDSGMVDENFNKFWAAFPNRKGKGDAMKAFKTASKLASLEEMLDGITRYVANKPDWQAYKYPGSWLRGQHWADEWEVQQPKAPKYAPPQFQSTGTRFQSREEYLRAELERAERSFR